ncbi:MAG: ATP-binding cassette domain-containing protein [Oscillospiraceae bacterium]|nr:ATP-binding cassette domain-containing protein [Oscillospiraceae bacterium]
MNLELKHIHKSFGEKQVLTGISFLAEGGKAFGLLGRNGAGKTTSIRILMDVFPADSGEVLMDDKPIDYSKVGIGYLPEERGLYPKKKIIDQLVYFAQLKGMKQADAVKAVDYWLKRLGMTEHRNKRLDTLSKGNQQKIQLITALAHNPQIVILDEPFSGLDPVNAMLLKDVVKEEIARGKIVLFSSHQMNYIEEFCDSIAILNQGKVVLSGDLHDIKRNYTRDKLVVRSEQAGRIAAALGAQCKSIRQDELLIQLSSSDEKQNMMQMLTQKYNIDEIRVFEPSLNDIFVEYAGDQEAGGAK